MAIMPIRLITSNPNKLADISAILSSAGISMESQPIDLVEIQGTIEEISIAKCRAAAELVGSAVLIEDTAVYFNALNGLPGPYIKSFLTSLGSGKLHLVLAGFSDKSAEAVSTIGYCSGPGYDPVLFQGRIKGAIVPARGKLEYGWQACFEDLDSGKTLAEMTDGEKNDMSHLRKALDQFITRYSLGGNSGAKDGSDSQSFF